MCVVFVEYVFSSNKNLSGGKIGSSNSILFLYSIHSCRAVYSMLATGKHIKREREIRRRRRRRKRDGPKTAFVKRMDPAATLVVLLVVLVFGFLFGNIAL